jgi:hypothetical protein
MELLPGSVRSFVHDPGRPSDRRRVQTQARSSSRSSSRVSGALRLHGDWLSCGPHRVVRRDPGGRVAPAFCWERQLVPGMSAYAVRAARRVPLGCRARTVRGCLGDGQAVVGRLACCPTLGIPFPEPDLVTCSRRAAHGWRPHARPSAVRKSGRVTPAR